MKRAQVDLCPNPKMLVRACLPGFATPKRGQGNQAQPDQRKCAGFGNDAQRIRPTQSRDLVAGHHPVSEIEAVEIAGGGLTVLIGQQQDAVSRVISRIQRPTAIRTAAQSLWCADQGTVDVLGERGGRQVEGCRNPVPLVCGERTGIVSANADAPSCLRKKSPSLLFASLLLKKDA